MINSDPKGERTYRAIGRFIFEFSQLEYSLRLYLAEEIKLDERYFTAIVGSYDMALLCNVVKNVFQQSRPGATFKAIDDLIAKIKGLNDERVKVAHGLWVPFLDGGTLHHVSRGRLQSNTFVDRADSLEKLADDAAQLRSAFEDAILSFSIS